MEGDARRTGLLMGTTHKVGFAHDRGRRPRASMPGFTAVSLASTDLGSVFPLPCFRCWRSSALARFQMGALLSFVAAPIAVSISRLRFAKRKGH